MSKRTRKVFKRITLVAATFVAIITLFVIWVSFRTKIAPPEVAGMNDEKRQVITSSDGFKHLGTNWLKKSTSGLWEMYLEGSPFERGYAHGKLAESLVAHQEEAFIDQIKVLIPSAIYLHILKYFIYWFNRDIDKYITNEFKQEIFGISLSASDEFSSIGSNYQRLLNYHSAHDIGHALQDYKLVGCTSFGVWGKSSKDNTLIIGRNFDFYVGDQFAVNKIICFEKPSQGYPFMMVTWGGMVGVVSGMNLKGLTVTINAAKSKIPTSAKTPISLVAREILQYAANIHDAFMIARKRETFVSESILIGSAADGKAAIIEKSPYQTVLVMPVKNYITCANHFQSEAFSKDPLNILNKKENASVYRNLRLIEDITMKAPLDIQSSSAILRDQLGLRDQNIGMGNEKALNQLIAHHSAIFMPEKLLVWVSTSPWQIGPYVCYDLCKIFHNFAGLQRNVEITEADKWIPADSFIGSSKYQSFVRFKELKNLLEQAFKSGNTENLSDSFLNEFRTCNPEYYETYALIGDYYAHKKEWSHARNEYAKSLKLIIPRWKEKEIIIKKMNECAFKL